MSKDEICAELQISERTYYSDIKYIKKNMPEAESQDIDRDSAKILDAFSNSGPIGPNRLADAKPVTYIKFLYPCKSVYRGEDV